MFTAQRRSMATLKEIQMRLKSVSNIAKITKSMKMIASTKMTKAQRQMDVARVYAQCSNAFFTHASTPEALAAASQTPLDIAISSDRGLCGGIHSSVSKAVKKHVREHPSAKVVVIGQKAKPQIMREARKNIEITFDQVAKAQPNWSEAARITDQILMAKMPITSVNIFFNRFKSVIAFETTIQPVALRAQLTDKLNAYEVSPDVLTNYLEFAFANALYACIAEGNASEQAAKRTAMENATKNAGEMIQKLTLTYNRSRQATITNELIDIITGASAM